MTVKQSYHDIPPREFGGTNARNGFDFQDHVAASYMIEMLTNPEIIAVWCENLDDITVVRTVDGKEVFEFVQVKQTSDGKTWSVADLCSRDPNKFAVGTSVLEKSLDNDCGSGESRFRVVSSDQVNPQLRILTYPVGADLRRDINTDFLELKAAAVKGTKDYFSPNKNDASFWVDRAFWQVVHSEAAITNANLLSLRAFFDNNFIFLAPDQILDIYRKIVLKAYDAAKADFYLNKEAKRLATAAFHKWLLEECDKAQHPAPISGETRLSAKLKKAGLTNYTDTATRQRIFYATRSRDPKFFQTFDKHAIEAEAESALSLRKLKLDRGDYQSSIDFLIDCISDLKSIDDRVVDHITGLNPYLEGFMYNMANRCLFRFARESA